MRNLRSMAWVGAALLTAAPGTLGCRQTGAHAAAPEAAKAGDVRAAVLDVVHRQTAAIARGDVDSWLAWHADDVLWIGTDAGEVIVGRPTVSKAMHGFFDPVIKGGGHIEVAPTDVQIGASDDGHAAWLTESFALTVASPTPSTTPFRHTAVFGVGPDGIRLLAEAWTVASPLDDVVAKAASGKWATPVELGDAVASGAESLAAPFRTDLKAGDLAAIFSERPDASLVGAAAGERYAGGARARAAITERAFGFHPRGGVRAGLAPGGHAGWVMLNVDETLIDSKHDSAAVPVRVLAVLVDEGGSWRVVQAHLSTGA